MTLCSAVRKKKGKSESMDPRRLSNRIDSPSRGTRCAEKCLSMTSTTRGQKRPNSVDKIAENCEQGAKDVTGHHWAPPSANVD